MSSGLRSIASNIIASSASTIQKINFAHNELESLPPDIFNINASRESFQVFLHENKLKTLPQGIFNEAIKSSVTVTISLGNNDWHCDCDLAWLYQFIMNETILLYDNDNPVCESPTENKDKLLIEADFSTCITATTPSSTPSAASSTITTTMDSTIISPTTEMTTTDTTTLVQATNEMKLVWMNTDDTNNIHCNYTNFMKEKRDSLNMFNAEFKSKPNTSYTICAISQEGTISPLNCRAHTTLPSEENRPWLLNNQQTMIWAIFCFALLVTMMVGGVIIYIVVRHNPRILGCNKRVIVVGHRAAEVLVMPKDYSETDAGFRRASETSFYTARTSMTSYVTAIQPTAVQLIAWKFSQMKERLMANGKTEDEKITPSPNESPPPPPPPLPPYPNETLFKDSYDINFPYDFNSCYTAVM
ncbi:hypothetical protein B7P43_G09043 [Cryptotermes secundus]|uniref:LRRCT domain-containing protein n=1 Tax=Cryptotermes secundus TaxID=105785 RepID=A0A2J7PQ08_9NEOP|nr:hypothetical protein B7P43_G09043 [Cryptotermes secundus]